MHLPQGCGLVLVFGRERQAGVQGEHKRDGSDKVNLVSTCLFVGRNKDASFKAF